MWLSELEILLRTDGSVSQAPDSKFTSGPSVRLVLDEHLLTLPLKP